MRTAPDPASFKSKDIGEIFTLLNRFNELSPDQMAETIRFMDYNIFLITLMIFENDVIKASFLLSGIIGTALGPMSQAQLMFFYTIIWVRLMALSVHGVMQEGG